jgi:group I intron endonuclease
MEPYGRIYVIRCLVNGKVYVGQTTTPLRKRWLDHCQAMRKGTRRPLYNAMRKYGLDQFVMEELDQAADQEALNALEVQHGEHLNALVPHGYSCVLGNSGRSVSPYTSENLSKARRAYWQSDAGKAQRARQSGPRSEAWRTNHAQAVQRQAQTEQGRKQRSEMQKACWQDSEYRVKRAEITARVSADPAFRMKQAEKTRASWADPEKRAARIAKGKERWADPAYRAARIAASVEGKRKRRA